MDKTEYIHIIDLPDAQNNIMHHFTLKDEIDIITGLFAVAYIPLQGAKELNGFKSEGQFKQSLLSVKFGHCETVYCVPVHFLGIQGYAAGEESNFNFNHQLLFHPVPVYKKTASNTFLKVKYGDSLSDFRYKHNIRLYLTYTE